MEKENMSAVWDKLAPDDRARLAHNMGLTLPALLLTRIHLVHLQAISSLEFWTIAAGSRYQDPRSINARQFWQRVDSVLHEFEKCKT